MRRVVLGLDVTSNCVLELVTRQDGIGSANVFYQHGITKLESLHFSPSTGNDVRRHRTCGRRRDAAKLLSNEGLLAQLAHASSTSIIF